MACEVVVIGGGIVGISVARERALRPGCRLMIPERDGETPRGSAAFAPGFVGLCNDAPVLTDLAKAPAAAAVYRSVAVGFRQVGGLQDAARDGFGDDVPGVTAADLCRHDACVAVPPGAALTAGAHRTPLPGGQYADGDFRGTEADIGDAWSPLCRDWLPESKLQLNGRTCFKCHQKGALCDEHTGIVIERRTCVPAAAL